MLGRILGVGPATERADVDSTRKGEVAESSVAMVMNFLMIAFLLTSFQNLGIYAYLYRTEDAGSSSTRARQLMFGECLQAVSEPYKSLRIIVSAARILGESVHRLTRSFRPPGTIEPT